MAIHTKDGQIARLRRGKDAREAAIDADIRNGIAYQVRCLRDARGLSQSELAKLVGTTQSAIARIENPDYRRYSIGTLLKLAAAFDVALTVRFEPFSRYVAWTTSTPITVEGLSSATLAPPSFTSEYPISTL